MINKLHPDVRTVLVGRGLLAFDKKMAKNIGRRVIYKNWKPSMGTLARDHTFTIVGIQKDYAGNLCYRVTCNGFKDTFGRCANPKEIEFVS